jgi:signal transduction histidine kinase
VIEGQASSMATLGTTQSGKAGTSGTAPGLDPSQCSWDQDLRAAGVEPPHKSAIDVGVPVVVLTSLVVTGILAVAGSNSAPLALLLLAVAAIPWVQWLVHGDEGPTWSFLVIALGPIALLGVGHWFVDALSLGSDAAYPLLAFPGLLLIVIGLAVAEPRMAVGIGVAAYLSYGGPLLAAWVAGRDVDLAAVITWQVGFALAAVAGYAVRFSYRANAAVTEAREALAWQAAAEERRQVARDVHDVVAHTLAVTMLHITAARMAVNRAEPDVAVRALEEAERQGRASLADIRRIVRLLRADDTTGLDAVQPGFADIQALVDGYRAAGLDVDVALDFASLPGSASAELALYRVLQEALTNAVRYGRGPATVDLRATGEAMSLTVDNPIAARGPQRTRGNGLLGMQERIAAVGGTLEAGARDGRWVVHAVVPAGVPA